MKEKKKLVRAMISPKLRLMTIIHLCLVFTLMAWWFGQPFMGELFTNKSKMLLLQQVIGMSNNNDNPELQALFYRNQNRFHSLSPSDQELLLDKYEVLRKASETSFLTKLKQIVELALFKIPPFELAWIFFSLVLSIFLLFQVEGVQQAIWLLPLITGLYIIDNQLNGMKFTMKEEEKLVPSEEVILRDYLKEPLKKDIFEQHQQLKYGWHLYLVRNWAKEEPSHLPQEFQKQVEKGKYAFNFARVERITLQPDQNLYRTKSSCYLLFAYLLWNFVFAYAVHKEFSQKLIYRPLSFLNNFVVY